MNIYWNKATVKSCMHKYWLQTLVRLGDEMERVMSRVQRDLGLILRCVFMRLRTHLYSRGDGNAL